MHQAGLLNHALQKSKPVKNRCLINAKREDKGGDIFLQLQNFGGAFFILGAGFFCALVAIIAEIIVKKGARP